MDTSLKLTDGNVELLDGDGNYISVVWDDGNAVSTEWIDQEECIIRVKTDQGLSFKVHSHNGYEMIICENKPRKKKRKKIGINDPLPDDDYSQGMSKKDIRNILELESIVNWYDPCQLLDFGFPDSEYGPEIGSIFEELGNVKTEIETMEMVYSVFYRWFGAGAGPKKKYKRMAKEIFESIVANINTD